MNRTGGQFGGPEGPPPAPPTGWQHMLHAIGGVVHFFGRISFLVDENAHAFHFFISALLQLLDRCPNPLLACTTASIACYVLGFWGLGFLSMPLVLLDCRMQRQRLSWRRQANARV